MEQVLLVGAFTGGASAKHYPLIPERMTASNTNTKPSASSGWLLIVCASVLVFYVFSPVLIIWLFANFSSIPPGLESVLTVVYAPLGFLINHVPGVEAFYDWLFSFFTSP